MLRPKNIYVDGMVKVDDKARKVLEEAGFKLRNSPENSFYILLVMPTRTQVEEVVKMAQVIALEVFSSGADADKRKRTWFKAGVTDVRACPVGTGTELGEYLLDILINA